MKADDIVAWKWSNGIAEGIVTEVCPEKTMITSNGKKIVRNGSTDNPALIIMHKSGNLVLKLQSEVQKVD